MFIMNSYFSRLHVHIDSLEQRPYKFMMKCIAHAELKEVGCCNTHLANWNVRNESIFGLKQLRNVVHLQDCLAVKYHTWLDDSFAAFAASPLTANSLHEVGDGHFRRRASTLTFNTAKTDLCIFKC